MIRHEETPTSVREVGVDYLMKCPVTWNLGSFSCVVKETRYNTAEEDGLREYNRLLAHDGNTPVKQLPEGTTFHRILPREENPASEI